MPEPADSAGRGALAPEHVVDGTSSPRQRWAMRLFPEGLRLAPEHAGEPAIHVLRTEALERLDIVDIGLAQRMLVVRKPRKRTFKLDRSAWADLLLWLGRDVRLRVALKHRLGMGVPVGIIAIISSLPVPGVPESGLPGVAFNPLFAALGVVIIVSAILARRRPHHALFLLDSGWFAVLAAVLVWRVAHGGSPFWLVVIALQIQLMWSGIKLYREFAGAGADAPP